jgi:hypothetical protein
VIGCQQGSHTCRVASVDLLDKIKNDPDRLGEHGFTSFCEDNHITTGFDLSEQFIVALNDEMC